MKTREEYIAEQKRIIKDWRKSKIIHPVTLESYEPIDKIFRSGKKRTDPPQLKFYTEMDRLRFINELVKINTVNEKYEPIYDKYIDATEKAIRLSK